MSAFTQGYNAYLYGIPVSLNPYSSENVYERAEWDNGWNEAQELYDRNGDSYRVSDG